MVMRVRDALKSKTPSLVSATSSACTRRLTQSPTPRRSNPSGGSGTIPAPRRTCPPRTQVIHNPKKSSQPMRPSMTRPSNGLGSWTQILMLGSARRLLKVLQAGPQETPWFATSPSMERHNPIIQTQCDCPWMTWTSGKSLTTSNQTSMICAGFTS